MNIYFAGSIRGGRDDKELYLQLIRHLATYGNVLTEHVGAQTLSDWGENGLSDKDIYQRDMARLASSDVLIAEVSTPSLGVGYEISQAENMGKKILCLYRTQPSTRLSAMIGGNQTMEVSQYQAAEDALQHIDNFFKSLGG